MKSRYLDEGTHRGPGVAMLCPELADSTVRGNTAIHDFAVRNREAADGHSFDMVVTWALEAASTSVVEYDIRSEAEEQAWAEIIQWDGDRVREVHAYILATAG